MSVLFEDFRIEWSGLPTQQSLGDLDTIGSDYRVLYFLRRSLTTLNEYQGGLTQLLQTTEFKKARSSLSEMDEEHITKANLYFQTHCERIKELRNEFGGHVKLRAVAFATSNFTSEFGKVTLDKSMRETYNPSLQLHYAGNVLAGAISSRLQGGTDFLSELRAALNLIMEGYLDMQGSMYALVHAFLWDRFG
jgi:hypothetical protein